MLQDLKSKHLWPIIENDEWESKTNNMQYRQTKTKSNQQLDIRLYTQEAKDIILYRKYLKFIFKHAYLNLEIVIAIVHYFPQHINVIYCTLIIQMIL